MLPYRQPAGLLTRKSSRAIVFPAFASDCLSDTESALVTYSDEIVQAFHLFPYYPFHSKEQTAPIPYSIRLHYITSPMAMQYPFFKKTTVPRKGATARSDIAYFSSQSLIWLAFS